MNAFFGFFVKVCLVLIGLFLISNNLQAQEIGDYRSVSSGDWTQVSIWQVYNGNTWTAATTYPGQLIGTNDVYVQGGYSVNISSNIPNTINSLTVGDGTGSVENFYIADTSSLQSQQITIANGGSAEWISNVSFSLPSGTAFMIEEGGVLVTDNPCSSAKRLIIGSTVYSTCNGGTGTDHSFDDLNDSGGSLAVSPSSDAPICEGGSLNLFSNPSGAGASGATYSWTATAPLGYGFSSTAENPVVSNLPAGTYTYSVTISDGTVSNTKSVDVTVDSRPTIDVQPQDQTVFVDSNANFSVTQSNGDGYQWQMSSDGGVNFSDILDGSAYNGTQTGNLTVLNVRLAQDGTMFRVKVSNSASVNCADVVSDNAVMSVAVKTLVTNRRITYRVKN